MSKHQMVFHTQQRIASVIANILKLFQILSKRPLFLFLFAISYIHNHNYNLEKGVISVVINQDSLWQPARVLRQISSSNSNSYLYF